MDVLLLEDEVNTREFFTMLLHNIPGVTKVLAAPNGEEAIRLASYHRPELILLDIELVNDDLTGMEVAQQIYDFDQEAYMIFVTAHSQYAISSFAVHPYSYILKPIVVEEFKAIVKEVVNKVNSQDKQSEDTIMVPIKRKKNFILKEDINFIEVQGKQTIINAKSGQWVTNKPLVELEKQLNSDFIRVHRAFIVNKKQIKSITQISDRTYEIELQGCSQRIPMSRSAYSKHKQLFR
jgi:two-component system LytT family response regulator